ncbi:hypothetical protein [Aureimonas frigidaquae]|uniref:hypothetical protein n=1 Tax=Aureimonas frigidaquae TaxID=424757 RepID=UPI000ACB1C53|nr:hypothetical protein [Aureimonas frigidaquae]
MSLVRRWMGDRLSGGVLAAMAGYFLILQVLMTGFACGASVLAATPDAFVICHPGTTAAASPADADADGHAALAGHDCPCVVCHAADPRLFAALPTGQDIGPAFSLQEPARPWFALRDDPAPSPAPLGLAPDPRGPPTLSA